MTDLSKPLAEQRYEAELRALALRDQESIKPDGWRLSPRAVRDFICGCEPVEAEGATTPIERKFFGDDALVERATITLTTSRGLLLVGEPGTAKTMLSELLCAAIGGESTLTIQGSAGTSEDQIQYGWNYAMLLDRGPSEEALVPGALYRGMKEGRLVRFEEITRCPAEVQDVMVSPLSDRTLQVPELGSVLQAKRGFNVIATANTRDRGVNDMSAALKRRFNFETVHPLRDRRLEIELVKRETNRRLAERQAPVELPRDVAELLVTTFQELRAGRSDEGERIDAPSTVMSTAEAVAVATSASLHAHYYGGGTIRAGDIARHLVGTAIKDDADDVERLKAYIKRIAKPRAAQSPLWAEYVKGSRGLR